MTGSQDRFRGMILGTAVGDAIGLPASLAALLTSD
jgi:ADP-ribosylglycohydrolase